MTRTRSVEMFRWKPGTTQADIDAVAQGFAQLRDYNNVLREFSFGSNALYGNFDYVVVTAFDDDFDHVSYRDNRMDPFVADHVPPHLAERAAIQYHTA